MARTPAIVALALLPLAATGCPSLEALECHGASCFDAAVVEAGRADAADAGEAGAPTGIRCGDGGARCEPVAEECCFRGLSSSCVQGGGGHCQQGTDVFCDDSAQCASGECRICLDKAGDLLGASCLASDLAGWACATPGGIRLCRAPGECEGGATCQALAVSGLPSSPGSSWFQACQ